MEIPHVIGTFFVAQTEFSHQTQAILETLLTEFTRIFGEKAMTREFCLVYNDPNSECPSLLSGKDPLAIRLHQKSPVYWAQTVYQLSHELCHYAIYIHPERRKKLLGWFEELLCESMSLYALDYMAKNWKTCYLSKVNPGYKKSFISYLEDLLAPRSKNPLAKCKSEELMRDYAKKRRYDRESRLRERNALYREILKNPLACRCFVDYVSYIAPGGATVDFAAWQEADPMNSLIPFMRKLQPI